MLHWASLNKLYLNDKMFQYVVVGFFFLFLFFYICFEKDTTFLLCSATLVLFLFKFYAAFPVRM